MNRGMEFHLAKRNIKANKITIFPFILSSGVMLSLLFIMISLSQNEYVKTRHEDLTLFMNVGAVLTTIITGIFLIYGNKYLFKNRNKEFALYSVLGLEKKHIGRILFLEELFMYLAIYLVAVVMGTVLGKLMFLFMGYIFHDASTSVKNFELSPFALLVLGGFHLFMLLLLHGFNVGRIRFLSPVKLLKSDKKGKGDVKTKYILLLLGIICLGSGYYIALTREGVLDSLRMFILAVFLVVFGTYFLFLSLGVFVLKKMRKNERYYYKEKNFLFVSGMMKKLTTNAISLASIAIIATGLLVTLSSTLTAYQGIEKMIENTLIREYSISKPFRIESFDMKREEEKLKKDVEKQFGVSPMTEKSVMVAARKEGNSLSPLRRNEADIKNPYFLIIKPLDDYNQIMGEKNQLGQDEILLSGNFKEAREMEEVNLNGKIYKAKYVDAFISANIGVQAFVLVTKDYQSFLELAAEYGAGKVDLDASFDGLEGRTYTKAIKALEKKGCHVTSIHEMRKNIYELNGGLIMLGVIVSMVLLCGMILIMYYKQISEARDDREGIQIMKKVGLSEDMIRKSTDSQVVWMFFLPLVVALIHSLFASDIMGKLLFLLGVKSFTEYFFNLVYIALGFGLLYFIIFRQTSKTYMDIVN